MQLKVLTIMVTLCLCSCNNNNDESNSWQPLVNPPGIKFGYSNFTSHMMGIIISRSAYESLLSFTQNHLFNDIDISVTYWQAVLII